MKKLDVSYFAHRIVKLHSHFGNQLAVAQNVKHRVTT